MGYLYIIEECVFGVPLTMNPIHSPLNVCPCLSQAGLTRKWWSWSMIPEVEHQSQVY